MRAPSKRILILAISFCLAQVVGAQSSGEADLSRLADSGQLALAAGQFEQARVAFEQLEKLQPGIAEVHATLAVIYFKLREYNLTVGQIRQAQKLKPSLPKLDSLLGLSLAEMNEFQEAEVHLERGFRQNTDPEVRRMCGLQLLRSYTNLHRDSDAVEVAISLNKLYPNDPEVLYHTGRIYGNYAYIMMERLRDEAPNSIWMLQAQGEAYESQKMYDAAMTAFQRVLEIDPHRPGVHYRMGRVNLAQFHDAGKVEYRHAAKREFEAELSVDPRSGNAAYELAQIAAEDNELGAAQQQFESLLQRFPDFEEALVGLGGVFLVNHQPQKALEPLKRATRIVPADQVAWYRLGQAERGAGNRDAAEKAMQTFQALRSSSGSKHNVESADEVTPQRLGPDVQP